MTNSTIQFPPPLPLIIAITTGILSENQLQSVPAIPIGKSLVPIDDPDSSLKRLMTLYKGSLDQKKELAERLTKPIGSQKDANRKKVWEIELSFTIAFHDYTLFLMKSHLDHHYNRGKHDTGVFRQNESFIKAQRREHEQKERDIRSWAIFVPGHTDCNCSPPAEVVTEMISSGNL